MQRALELAKLGKGNVSPNPLVGCVIAHEGVIIGEGFHQKYGEAHAEVNAVNSIQNPELLNESTVYVTLEPCSHFGKTPPCSDLLIEKKVKKVIVASQDPFEKVDGKGIEKLIEAGIDVELGILKDEAEELNKRFFTFHKKKRPFVILKWAQTEDGFIARENGDSKWISNSFSRQLVHKWRAEEDAILVGKNTAILDNPSLTVRDWDGKNPIRVLLDSQLEVSGSIHLYKDEAKTFIFNTKKENHKGSNIWLKMDSLSPLNILGELYKQGIQSIIIEGGTQVLNSFIKDNCWDEARVFEGKTTFGQGVKAPVLNEVLLEKSTIENDQLFIYKNNNG